MGHMVIFRGGDGKPGYHQVDELSEAIHHVEHLRNNEGIDHAQIFQMEEVTFEFRPYFRVEVATSTAPPMASDDLEPEAEADVQVDEAAPSPVASWAARVKEVRTDEDDTTEVPEPASELAAMVGEPAGEPWPAHDAPAGNDEAALTSNGVRRGLFGR